MPVTIAQHVKVMESAVSASEGDVAKLVQPEAGKPGKIAAGPSTEETEEGQERVRLSRRTVLDSIWEG